jgi:hypothetical protein
MNSNTKHFTSNDVVKSHTWRAHSVTTGNARIILNIWSFMTTSSKFGTKHKCILNKNKPDDGNFI